MVKSQKNILLYKLKYNKLNSFISKFICFSYTNIFLACIKKLKYQYHKYNIIIPCDVNTVKSYNINFHVEYRIFFQNWIRHPLLPNAESEFVNLNLFISSTMIGFETNTPLRLRVRFYFRKLTRNNHPFSPGMMPGRVSNQSRYFSTASELISAERTHFKFNISPSTRTIHIKIISKYPPFSFCKTEPPLCQHQNS